MIMKLGDRMQYLSFGKHFYLLVVFLVTAAPPVLHACVLELGELVSAVTSPGLQQNLQNISVNADMVRHPRRAS